MALEETLKIGQLDDATYKDAWAISVRPQIQQLMAGSPDNHVVAVTLLIPWMDRLYTLETGEPSKGKTKNVVAHFFRRLKVTNLVV